MKVYISANIEGGRSHGLLRNPNSFALYGLGLMVPNLVVERQAQGTRRHDAAAVDAITVRRLVNHTKPQPSGPETDLGHDE